MWIGIIYDIQLADHMFGHQGRIDVLSVDISVQILSHDRWVGPLASPVAFETELGWVLAGNSATLVAQVTTSKQLYFAKVLGNWRKSNRKVVYVFWGALGCLPFQSRPLSYERWEIHRASPTEAWFKGFALKRYVGFSPLNTHSNTKVSLRKWIQSSKNILYYCGKEGRSIEQIFFYWPLSGIHRFMSLSTLALKY